MIHTKRIYMNEADGSPGNAAPATPTPPAPAAPNAAPTAPEQPALTVEAIANIVATTVDTKIKAFENGFFANARKAGLLGKDKSAPDSSATPNATAAPSTTALTEAELDARLEQERVITKAQVENKLSDAAVKRMKSALRTEKPEDVGAWTSAYLADLGLVRTNNESSTTVTPSAPVLPNTAPISDRGSPAPAGAVGWRYELSNPIGMSAAARAQMDAELGADKARRMRIEAAQTQAEKMRVTFGPKG
jgi:hypothetical protein